MTKKTITIKRVRHGQEKVITLTRVVYLHVDILEAYFNKALARDIVLDFDSLCDSVIGKMAKGGYIMKATDAMQLVLNLEKCKECNNTDFEYVEFTSKSVCQCTQCKTEYYLENEV
jgi:predicted Zn-ribbon and HTH transcriptional regulator